MEAVAIQKHEEHKEKIKQVYNEVAKVVVGQEYMVNRLMIGLFTNGHIFWKVFRTCKNPYGEHTCTGSAPGFSTHTIHARPASSRSGGNNDIQSDGRKV